MTNVSVAHTSFIDNTDQGITPQKKKKKNP